MRRAAAVTAAALAALAALSAAGSPTPPDATARARASATAADTLAEDSPLARINPWMSACDLHQYHYGHQTLSSEWTRYRHQYHREICSDKASPEGRAAEAARLTLPHCRERTFASALDSAGRAALGQGGSSCRRLVDDLLAVDALATKVSGDLDFLLLRYDCRQVFSVINDCEDCKEAYRRWVCGSLVPYFVLESGVVSAGGSGRGERDRDQDHPPARTPPPERQRRGALKQSYELYASNNKNNKLKRGASVGGGGAARTVTSDDGSDVYSNDTTYHLPGSELYGDGAATYNGSGGMQDRRPLDNRLQGRARRDQAPRAFLRIKPCLSQCQDVEQACPYFLPGDRTPPQYAGEPTFLCLDPNIEEVGDQLQKSNYGRANCCYWYCGRNKERLCSRCSLESEEEEELARNQPFAGECVATTQPPPSTCAASASASASASSAAANSGASCLYLVLLIASILKYCVQYDSGKAVRTSRRCRCRCKCQCRCGCTCRDCSDDTIHPCTRL